MTNQPCFQGGEPSLSRALTEEVREWLEATATYFQDEADLDVGVDWMFHYQEDL